MVAKNVNYDTDQDVFFKDVIVENSRGLINETIIFQGKYDVGKLIIDGL